ncbi:MAG: 50S ribosomal protein L3 [Alphaproteobacteria bacterium]|nr:50S ribosomal protein L3 [Alphaproteobacteria bacterium]
MNKNPGLLGRKVGMTQFFNEDGNVVPCTVIEAGPCTVLQVKTGATKDGYNAIQVGFGEQKEHRITKPQKGHFDKAGATPKQHVREFRMGDVSGYTVGQQITVGDVFQVGQRVDVIGTSKGKGYSGVMKRHNFRGFLRSHGTHEFFRHGGSIGTRLTPGHVAKGTRMSGQMGNKRVTVMNLLVAKVDPEKNLVYLRGAIPGATGGLVSVRGTMKTNKK